MINGTAKYIPEPVEAEHLEGDLVLPGDPRYGVIWVNPERLGGTPCFYGTRVPVHILFDHIESGETIAEFLEGFPPITREHVVAVLELAEASIASGSRP